MIRIGISYNPSLPLFFSGFNQTSLLLCELFLKLGYEVTLVDTKNCENDWWDTYPKMNGVKLSKYTDMLNLDYFIDIDGFVFPEYRTKIAKKTVVFLRSFLQFSELDKSVYPEKEYTPRSFDNVSEIWCWDILNPTETLDSVQTLFKCPIKTVPFIWSPSVISHYVKNAPLYNPNTHWITHIAEKNSDNTSSSIIPLVAIRELTLKRVISSTYKCHNMERIRENRFLKENILDNIEVSKLPVEFVEKEEFYKWVLEENSIFFSHSRFVPLRIALLNAIWTGIPLIHNSPVLKMCHPVLSNMFYSSNKITDICNVFNRFSTNPREYYDSLANIRESILQKWGIDSNLDGWREILWTRQNILKSSINTINTINTYKNYIIAFMDMWDGFNCSTNFFIDSLKHEIEELGLHIKVEGVPYSDTIVPNLVIFGPFTDTWKQLPTNIPKVCFSGENWKVVENDSIDLHLTCSYKENDKYIRIPVWMLYIDWFSGSTQFPSDSTDNPIRIPLHFAMNPHPISFNDRSEFCGFVVSNPSCSYRNDAFTVVNNYKRVNSGGALYNNIGGQLNLKYPGGGSGDISKYNFFSKHKFSISFENSQASGYITEKVLHAKIAGCIPIYWGDPVVDRDFVPESIVNVSMIQNLEEILEIIKDLEQNDTLCEKITSTPILDIIRVKNALQTIQKMSRQMLSLMGVYENKRLEKIDNIFVVNLDNRTDRWNKLCIVEPRITAIANRVSAVNGKQLKLTQDIQTLFRNNTFGWNKSVMGCALSHYNIWKRILSEPGSLFMILEDDVRFCTLDNWDKYAEFLPNDAELLYIGGILPPNMPVLPHCIEPINAFWGKIKPNSFFTPGIEMPIFHFCTYSYIVSKSGVQKILQYLEKSDAKLTKPVDHFLSNMSLSLCTYVATPLITQCFQDNDPNYLNAEFNNPNKLPLFDSDICGSTDCFSDIDFIEDKSVTIYCLNNDTMLYEDNWICDVLSKYKLKKLVITESFAKYDDCLFLVQRPHLPFWNTFFKQLNTANIPFNVLHLSDEGLCDDIEFYSYPNCKAVVRNYLRRGGYEGEHILTIPLGYHYKGENIKTFQERELIWSFHGTDWFNRRLMIEPIYEFTPNNCHFVTNWDDPQKTEEKEYLQSLENSKFCPILRGNNIETFRLYEAVEAGVIPLYVRIDGDAEFWELISSKLGLIHLDSWEKARGFIEFLLGQPEYAEKYRQALITKWQKWKLEIQSSCRKLL